MMDTPYAEDLNYWKTSRSDADTWLEKAERVVEGYGATVTHRAMFREHGREAMLLQFEIDGEAFRLAWPVLESKTGDERSARRQAATMLYHDAKARGLLLAVFGARFAFLAEKMLADGRTVAQLADVELDDQLPALMTTGDGPRLLATIGGE